MAKKAKKKSTAKAKTRTRTVVKTVVKKTTKKAGRKLFKVKKGKELIKGVASVAVNAVVQKAMDSAFDGRIKKENYPDEKSYNDALEKQKTLRAGANIGLWLVGAGNVLPQNYVSKDYLEINALEHGIKTLLNKSDKTKKAVPFIQGNNDPFLIEASNQDENYFIESANTIERAMIEAEQEIAFLESAEDPESSEEVVYEIEGIETIPGIEEEY
jgi:hypothetical protein